MSFGLMVCALSIERNVWILFLPLKAHEHVLFLVASNFASAVSIERIRLGIVGIVFRASTASCVGPHACMPMPLVTPVLQAHSV